jgi:hypothetical protein
MTTPAAARTDALGGRVYPIPAVGQWLTDESPRLPSITRCLDVIAAPGLVTWKMKRVAHLVATDLGLQALAADESTVYEAVKRALDRSDQEANIGTAVHALSERIDAGTLNRPAMPPVVGGFLDAYSDASALFGFDIVATEVTVFNHEVGYAGTADRLLRLTAHPGLGLIVADLKTGKDVYAEMAMQLAALANAQGIWDHATQTHQPMPDGLRTDIGLVIHLRPERWDLVVVDLTEAWPAYRAAVELWRWREQGSKRFQVTRWEPGDPAPAPTPEPAAPSDPVAEGLIAWIRGCVRVLVADYPVEADLLRLGWPEGCPALPLLESAGLDQLGAVREAIYRVERDSGTFLPLPAYAPEGEQVQPPVELAPPDAIDALRQRLMVLPADLLADIAARAEVRSVRGLNALWTTPADLGLLTRWVADAEEGQRKRMDYCQRALTERWEVLDDASRNIILEACTPDRHADLRRFTGSDVARLDAVLDAFGAADLSFTADGAGLLVTAPTEVARRMAARHGGRDGVVAAAAPLAVAAGLTPPRSITAASEQPILVALMAAPLTAVREEPA